MRPARDPVGARRAPTIRPVSIDHYENFPVASWLCPPPLRAAVAAIYWFARTADDLADEGEIPAPQRLELLAAYRADLHACAVGQPVSGQWSTVFSALGLAISRHALPLPLLDALLDAFEQDMHNPRYANRAQLLAYCARSANPVGRLLLHLYQVNDEASLTQSDAICSALQLINFWQDLSVDLPRGRMYVPMDDLRQHALTAEQLFNRQDSAKARALVRSLSHWAAQLMAQGAPLARRITGRAGWELRLVVQGGLRILEKIAQMDHASLQSRPALRRRDAPLLLWRALWTD
jgi:hydroxysqualene synthase